MPQQVVVEHREDFTNLGTGEGVAPIKDQGEIASEGCITHVLTIPDAMVDIAAIDFEDMTGMTALIALVACFALVFETMTYATTATLD